jgi:hypothetical protein
VTLDVRPTLRLVPLEHLSLYGQFVCTDNRQNLGPGSAQESSAAPVGQ